MKKTLKLLWKLKSTVCLKNFLQQEHVFRVRAFVSWQPSCILQMHFSTGTTYCTGFSITQFLQYLILSFEALCLYTFISVTVVCSYFCFNNIFVYFVYLKLYISRNCKNFFSSFNGNKLIKVETDSFLESFFSDEPM